MYSNLVSNQTSLRLSAPAVWLGPIGFVVGIAGSWVAGNWREPRLWIPDLITGWVLMSCGLIGWARRPESRAGALLTATGFAWFAGNFADLPGLAGWLAVHAAFLHRGTLVQLLVTFPGGRTASALDRITVTAGYLVAVLTAFWRNEGATLLLTVLLVAACTQNYRAAAGRFRRARMLSLRASIGIGVTLSGAALLRFMVPSGASTYPSLLGYELALCAVAVSLLVGLLNASWERAEVTDLVIELGMGDGRTLDSALGWAVGDPSLRVGLRTSDSGVFVDASGKLLPPPGIGRTTTVIEQGGKAVATVLHDSSLLDDPGLLDAVSAAARLVAANAMLRADVQTQVAEVRASRQRMVQAAEDEGRRLERSLHDGAQRRLAEVADIIGAAEDAAETRVVTDRIQALRAELTHAIAEVSDLAHGLHPRLLTEQGLAAALSHLAAGVPIPVGMRVSTVSLPPDVEATAYFVCAEALTNVARHSGASSAAVTIDLDGADVHIQISDDGIGGAAAASGTGLLGLADRVEAVGGNLRVSSQTDCGTTVLAEIPVPALLPLQT